MLADRVAAGAALHRAGRVEKVLVSGDHGRVDYDEVNAMRRALRQAGVPDRDIFTDHAGFDTWDSVVRACEVFGVERAIVVTQRFHVARAVWLARRAGLQADGVIADGRDYGGQGIRSGVREVVARTKALPTWSPAPSPRSSARASRSPATGERLGAESPREPPLVLPDRGCRVILDG